MHITSTSESIQEYVDTTTRRAVWATITAYPDRSDKAIARSLGKNVVTVKRHIDALEKLGYIELKDGKRIVLIPFALIGKK